MNEEQSKEAYDRINQVYNDVEDVINLENEQFDENDSYISSDSLSDESSDIFGGRNIEGDRTEDREDKSERDLGKTPNEKEKTVLSDVIDAKTGTILVDQLMSNVSSTCYNIFAKDHKCSPKDWALSQAQLDGLYPVTKALMDSIEVSTSNPYYAFFGVLIGMYTAKFGEVRAHYKSGTDLRKEADVNKFMNQNKKTSSSNSGTGKSYVRKYIGKGTERQPNPDHPDYEQILADFQLKNN